MITLAFERNENSIYVAHTDIIRSLNRTFRRAGIEVSYSKGFNQHMNLNLTSPLPYGVQSKQEWVTADAEIDLPPEKIIELFNNSCPPYMKAYECFILEKNPNLAAVVTASDYLIKTPLAYGRKKEILEEIYKLEIPTKKEAKSASEYIYKADADENGIYIMSAYGAVNLRIDDTAKRIEEIFNLGIDNTSLIRLCQYVGERGGHVKVSDYLKTL